MTGAQIRHLRTSRKLNGQQFAALVGVSPEHLSRVENGHRLATRTFALACLAVESHLHETLDRMTASVAA